MNWSATPLGPLESWPASLRAIAGTVVAAPAPLVVLWGAELVQIYNDAYRSIMGSKHPAGLGQATHDCWPEVRDFTAPLYEEVVKRRESFTFHDHPLALERHDYPETAYFTLTFSPLLDDEGEVGGVLITVTETTAAVERAHTEKARQESEERLRLALEAANLGTWELDLVNGEASSRSLRHDQIFGYQEMQPTWGEATALRHIVPEDRPRAERAFVEARNTGVLIFEARVRWPDESIHWIYILGRTYYDDGRPVRMAGVVADITAQNRIAALRESEERFRLMADTIPQLVWVTNAAGDIEFLNRQWRLYTGQQQSLTTTDELTRMTIHPDDVAATLQAGEEARRSGETLLIEHRVRSAGGDYRWFLARAEPYRDPTSGEISRWFGASVDIHDRKLAEATLRQASQFNAFRVELDKALRPIADPREAEVIASRILGEQLRASRVFYSKLCADMRHAEVSSDYCDGVSSLVGSYDLNLFGPDLLAEAHAGLTLVTNDIAHDPRHTAAERERMAALGVAARIVVPLIKDGRAVASMVVHHSEPRIWTESEVKMVEETAERTWATIERAQVEEALRGRETKYRTLFESMDQGFGVAKIFFDSAGSPIDFRWLEANPAFERHTGFSVAHDRTVFELLPDLERYWADVYGRIVKTGKAERFVEGSEALGRWFDVYAFPFGEQHSNQVAVLFSDITERQKAEAAIQRANARLIESDRRKDEFLAMLAHELRNPLAAIGNTVKLLERRPEVLLFTDSAKIRPGEESPNEEQTPSHQDRSQRYLDILNRQTAMLRGLVDDLLDVSRITRGLVELKRQRVNLIDTAERALESVQPALDEKGHDVSVTLPRKPVEVMGDPVRLEQIIANLLTNAIKYTDPGGRIALCLEQQEDFAELKVIDTGIGMTQEVLDRIFDLFGQAERGLARSEGGLGIGLTIVKNLVELHGGKVRASSEGSGKGAEVCVALPLASVEQTASESGKKKDKAPVRGKRVLVVDDSSDIAETMALLLEILGHTVALASDGPEALEKAEEFRPEIILLDIGLPGMDGYEVARRLRQNPQTQHAVLAALTGYGQADDIKRALAAGFAKHFTKPVDIEGLETFINSADTGSSPHGP